MRRALGLTGNTPARSTPNPSPVITNGSHPSRRHFIRDGEVPVTIVRHHHPDTESTNQLDAARNAIRSLATAKEHAERLLEQAQATIRQLQTTVAHERLANDEAIGRANADRRTVEHALETVRTELSAEKIARERAEQALRGAQSTITNLTEKLHDAQQALATVKAEVVAERQNAVEAARTPIAALATDAPANGDAAVQTVRRPVGRPRKQTTVGKPIAAPATAAPADCGQPMEPVRRPRGRPRKPAVVQTVEKAAKKPRAKPVKWWLRNP